MQPAKTYDTLISSLEKLTAAGILGFFNCFEVTEILHFEKNGKIRNLFSIFVAEGGCVRRTQEELPLVERIRLPKPLTGFVGAFRHHLTIAQTIDALKRLSLGSGWCPNKVEIEIGALLPIAPVFVPANSSSSVPLNYVLKNNFWEGSYVVELFDHKKEHVSAFFDHPSILMDVSKEISQRVALSLASLSDRLGNIVFQLPSDVVRTSTTRRRGTNDLLMELVWHPLATPRPLKLNCFTEFDSVLSGFNTIDAVPGINTLTMPTLSDEHRVVLFDPESQFVLSASSPTSFVESIGTRQYISDDMSRTFTMLDGTTHVVKLQMLASESRIGTVSMPQKSWTAKRIYTQEYERLSSQRQFKQYTPHAQGILQTGHVPIEDLRYLINRHGEGGVWLWDPYLTANDVLNTMFFCHHAGAALRALTSAKRAKEIISNCKCNRELPSDINDNSSLRWIAEQRSELEANMGDVVGLNLEFRARHGAHGWDFHDRFLIFPDTSSGAIAFSLGISVNQYGKSHHILQQADNGRLIADAFENLWGMLDHDAHLVWKTPGQIVR